MEASPRPSPRQLGGTKGVLGGHHRWPQLAGVGDSTTKPTSTPRRGALGTLSSLGSRGLAGGAGVELSEFKVREAQAGRSVAAHRHLVAALETTKPGGVSALVLGFSVEGFPLSLLPAGLCHCQNPHPLTRVRLDVAGYQRAPPRRFKPDRKINPPRKSFFPTSPFSDTHCPRGSPLLPLLA